MRINNMDAKEYFYEYLLQNLTSNKNNELYNIIKKEGQQSNFFELCNTFLEIPLNSEKFKDENGNIGGCFKFEDINKSKIATKQFVDKYEIQDIDNLFEIIHDNYKKAKNSNDNRNSSGMIRSEDMNYSIGLYGTYYDFTEIPVWDDIVTEITQFINIK